MPKTDFTLNTKDFDIKISAIDSQKIPQTTANAFKKVSAMVIYDAIRVEPKCPHKTGNLWRSQKIEEPQIIHNEISIEQGFDAEYAAAVHERTDPKIKWTEPGSGSKFLETKLSLFRDKYIAKLAELIEKASG